MSQLLESYQKTHYGQEFSADKVSSIEEFQRAFPVVTYADLKPRIERVMAGDFSILFPEPPVEWGLTRGTKVNLNLSQ